MKKRRVGNLMAAAVLSALAHRPMHPYEMVGTLRGWGKDNDFPIKWGSLYTVVRNLARHGLIAEVESVRAGRRPERTVYRITDAGRGELVDWTRELLSAAEPEMPRFRAGLSIMAVLPPDDVVVLLRSRAAALDDRIAALRAELAHESAPRLFLVEVEYDLALLVAEADWTRSLADEIATGAFPGLAEWRAHHDS